MSSVTALTTHTQSFADRSRSAVLLRALAKNRLAFGSFVVIVVLTLCAALAPILAPQNPFDLAQLTIVDGRLPPGATGESGTHYWLGTDEQGRDILSAILYGLRISLLVGVVSVAIALLFGAAVGFVAGYFGGRIDAFLMRIVDLQLSFPTLLIALVLLAILGKGADKIIAALVAAQWAMFARTARGVALVERDKDYIAAARSMAAGNFRILCRHLVPNCLSPLIVMATIAVAHAIGLEATLSFLGLGVPVTQPSLGMLIANGFEYMLSGRYWISVYPGLALLVTIMSINFAGDGLREILNPRLRGNRASG